MVKQFQIFEHLALPPPVCVKQVAWEQFSFQGGKEQLRSFVIGTIFYFASPQHGTAL